VFHQTGSTSIPPSSLYMARHGGTATAVTISCPFRGENDLPLLVLRFKRSETSPGGLVGHDATRFDLAYGLPAKGDDAAQVRLRQ
jgi:hypothetical protein